MGCLALTYYNNTVAYAYHHVTYQKVKKAQNPVRWPTQTALICIHFIPFQTCSFRHQLGFYGKHSSHASITFPPLSIARYSFIRMSEFCVVTRERTKMPNLWNGSKCGFELLRLPSQQSCNLSQWSCHILQSSYTTSPIATIMSPIFNI